MISPVVIGIGNEYRSDDGVGLYIVRRLRSLLPSAVTVIEETGEGTRLMDSWKDARRVFLFDAVYSKTKPGTIFRFDAREKPIPKKFFNYSTHAFSIAEAVEMARALNQLPEQLIIFGIEGKNFQSGKGLSAKVEIAAKEVVIKAREEILLPG